MFSDLCYTLKEKLYLYSPMILCSHRRGTFLNHLITWRYPYALAFKNSIAAPCSPMDEINVFTDGTRCLDGCVCRVCAKRTCGMFVAYIFFWGGGVLRECLQWTLRAGVTFQTTDH